jgi:hypothetical protein
MEDVFAEVLEAAKTSNEIRRQAALNLGLEIWTIVWSRDDLTFKARLEWAALSHDLTEHIPVNIVLRFLDKFMAWDRGQTLHLLRKANRVPKNLWNDAVAEMVLSWSYLDFVKKVVDFEWGPNPHLPHYIYDGQMWISLLAAIGYYERPRAPKLTSQQAIWAINGYAHVGNTEGIRRILQTTVLNLGFIVGTAARWNLREFLVIEPDFWNTERLILMYSHNDYAFSYQQTRKLIDAGSKITNHQEFNLVNFERFSRESMMLWLRYFGPPRFVFGGERVTNAGFLMTAIEVGLISATALQHYWIELKTFYSVWRKVQNIVWYGPRSRYPASGRDEAYCRFWQQWFESSYCRASVWFYAMVVVSDGLFRVAEAPGAVHRFLRITCQLPQELQWEIAQGLAESYHRVQDEAALHWLLKLLYDSYYTA